MLFQFDTLFEEMHYPAGEPHIRLKEENLPTSFSLSKITIQADAWNYDDLALIVLGNEILHRYKIKPRWLIPYFPFARHDRRNDRADAMTLEFAIRMVDGLDIVIVDPHSDVSGVLPHYTQANVVKLYSNFGIFDNYPTIVIPDAGAAKKVYEWIPHVSMQSGVIQALKRRDVKTGKLSGFRLTDVVPENSTNALIVDDICDGGGTFIGLGEILRENGFTNLTLAVTHGLFTKGLDLLFNIFDTIYTLDTCKLEHSRLVKVPTKYLLEKDPI